MRKTVISVMLALALSANAQQTFNEMSYTPTATTFKLFAPNDAKKVVVRIYNDGQKGKAVKTIKMTRTANETWTATVNGNLDGKFYTFDMGRGECPGVFAKAVGVNGKRAAIIDLSTTNPEGWENDNHPVVKSPTDHVIYEVHQRDYSIHPSSGFKYAGKYLAWTEPRALAHLKELGVNTVHFQPVYDYASVDESKPDVAQFNWGYDPLNYNVPEGYYSTDAANPKTRISEFKKMVKAFHDAGIRVVFDAVYNHTMDIDNSNFQRTYPDYFYRKNADGKYSDGSGCGNETASDREMMRKFMIESVKYWINEYHIDGFRFDLMGIHDIETMNMIRAAVDEIDPTLLIYGEGWSCSPCAYPIEKLAMKIRTAEMPGIAAFNDDMRDALRGPFNDDHKGAFIAGLPGNEQRVMFGIAGCINHPQVDLTKANSEGIAWASHPTQTINYVSCHDDMCLVDRLRSTVPGIAKDELIRLDLLAQTAVMTSQGVAFMLGGEEMLRDKKGVHNSYNSPDSINQLDWNNLRRYPQVFNYYKNLIALRNNHPAFRLETSDQVKRHLEFLPVGGDCLIAYRLKNYAGRDSWRNIIVILNSNRAQRTVNIPQGNYTIVCADGVIDENGLGAVSGNEVIVGSQSALIIHD